MSDKKSILDALNEFGRNNAITRAGEYWSADNAAFEQRQPTLLNRTWRAVNPMTGFGSAMGAMQDAASQGSPTQAGLALLQALPLFGPVRTVVSPAHGAIKATLRNVPDTRRLLLTGGADIAVSVGVDEVQARGNSHGD